MPTSPHSGGTLSARSTMRRPGAFGLFAAAPVRFPLEALVRTTLFVALTVALSALPRAFAAPAAGSPELHLAAGTFRPLDPASFAEPGWFHAASFAHSASEWRYLVAITQGPLDAAARARMESAGAEILDYFPDHGYRVRIAPGSEDSLRALPFFAWVGELPAHTKVELSLAALAQAEADAATAAAGGSKPAAAMGAGAEVRVVLFSGESVERVLEAFAGLSATAAPSGRDDAWRVTAHVPAGRIASALSAAAALPEVEAIETAHRFRFLNQDAVWVHQSFVGPSPQQTPVFDRGIYGCGQIVGVADSGQDYDTCFFRDTVNGAPPIVACAAAPCPAGAPAPGRRKDILYYNWSGTPNGDDDTCPATITGASGHGTHTSGSIAGDNAPYASCATFASAGRNGGDGQAPGAKLVIQEMGDGLEYLNERGGTLWNLADVAFQNGARIHSDSWGGGCVDVLGECIPGCTVPYDSFARDADLAMWSHPDLLLLVAAGNSGCPAPISISSPGTAKNIVTVGALQHGVNAAFPSSFSSDGPVDDGRLKPTVGAQGESTVSADSDANPGTNNCGTCSLDGTSMAAPTAAGLAALVREYYTAGFYATGARNAGAGIMPTGALVKATLVDGAVALSGAAPGPDFDAGYGRILLGGTLAFTGSPFVLRADDRREGIVTGGVVTHAYDVAAGTPFRATLAWTDYPAALGAAVARVNELKLEVIDPSGTVWFQTLDAGTGAPKATSNPADPHDARNVEERLVFNAPAAGRWVVRVRGVNVPWGPQPFALLVRGALSNCPAPAAPGTLTLTTPADHQVRVSWTAVSGAASYDVYRGFGACPGGPPVLVASGVSGTTYLDTTVSGGTTYSYVVTAASDPQGFCESAASPCKSVVPTGDCFLAPSFHGVVGAASAGTSACAVTVGWDPGSAYCGSDLRYNVYRSTTSGFTPGPSNRIARCVAGTSWADAVAIVSGTTYYYAVRAEDATTGHGGPCRGGNEDTNTRTASAAAFGPPAFGTFNDNAGDTGGAQLAGSSPWTIAASGGNAGPKVYTAASAAGACADLQTPVLTLADPGQGPQLFFSTKYNLAYDSGGDISGSGSLGLVEIATGPTFTDWTRLPLTQGYPHVVLPINLCPTTQGADTYFTDSAPAYSLYSASLVNWGGGDVKLRFHLSGDLIFDTGNWWIDDVSITHTLVPSACTAASAGPPPIPDGAAVPGVEMQAVKSGSQVVVTWDASRCPASAVNVYRGAIGNFGTFTAGSCGLPPTGTATLSIPNNAWFLVAATDGSHTDGSWGRTPAGVERVYAGASVACPAITQHVTNNGCP